MISVFKYDNYSYSNFLQILFLRPYWSQTSSQMHPITYHCKRDNQRTWNTRECWQLERLFEICHIASSPQCTSPELWYQHLKGCPECCLSRSSCQNPFCCRRPPSCCLSRRRWCSWLDWRPIRRGDSECWVCCRRFASCQESWQRWGEFGNLWLWTSQSLRVGWRTSQAEINRSKLSPFNLQQISLQSKFDANENQNKLKSGEWIWSFPCR